MFCATNARERRTVVSENPIPSSFVTTYRRSLNVLLSLLFFLLRNPKVPSRIQVIAMGSPHEQH
jgi:hypothetical protein